MGKEEPQLLEVPIKLDAWEGAFHSSWGAFPAPLLETFMAPKSWHGGLAGVAAAPSVPVAIPDIPGVGESAFPALVPPNAFR